MQWDIGLDFGETGVRLATRQRGVALCSPSWGAIRGGEVIAIGDDALDMVGRTPKDVVLEKPVSGGMIMNARLTAQWISRMVSPFISAGRLSRPNLLISDTGLFKQSERELMTAAALESGAQNVRWVSADILSGAGAGLEVMKPAGKMVVSVGAGVMSAAILSYGRIVEARRLPWGVAQIDRDIVHLVRSQAALSVGPRTAEEIKLALATALPAREMKMVACGLDLAGGFPKEREITAAMVRPAVEPVISALETLILSCAEAAPEEISADLTLTGVTLTGGGALLSGIAETLTSRTGLKCTVSETPELATVKGLAELLANPPSDALFMR